MTDIIPVKVSPAEMRRRLEAEAKKYTPGHRWEPWEDQLIRDFKGRVPAYHIAKTLNISTSQVEHRIEALGLRVKFADVPLAHMHPKHGRRRKA